MDHRTQAGEQGVHDAQLDHHPHWRAAVVLRGGCARQQMRLPAGVPADQRAQLGDAAVGGEDPRGLGELHLRPPADQDQGDTGAVQLQQRGRGLGGELPVSGVPEGSARPDHRAVHVGVDDPGGHAAHPGRTRVATGEWVESRAFHSSRGAEGHGPMKPRQPPHAHARGRCQFRPARLDGPSRGR